MMDDIKTFRDYLNSIDYISEEEVKEMGFYELALYLESLNKLEALDKVCSEVKSGDNNDWNGFK